jgi:hypothetical protein
MSKSIVAQHKRANARSAGKKQQPVDCTETQGWRRGIGEGQIQHGLDCVAAHHSISGLLAWGVYINIDVFRWFGCCELLCFAIDDLLFYDILPVGHLE